MWFTYTEWTLRCRTTACKCLARVAHVKKCNIMRMYVEVDGKSIGSFLSYEFEFKSSSFELQPGYHTVRFVYACHP